MTTTTAYETATAVPAAPLSRREEAQRLQLEREAFRAQQRRLDDDHWAVQDEKARASKDARRRERRKDRAAAQARRLAWLHDHTVDLLFVPVIVVPGALAWSAMAAYGRSVWGPLGFGMPAFSEGAMWAFSAAVAIRRRRNPDAPVWLLQLGVAIFAALGGVLNFLHGIAPTTAHHGLVVALSMAIVSVAGVTAHQLVVAGPRRGRAERELDRFRKQAERRQAAARRAAVSRALVDIDEDGHASLVYEPGRYQLRAGITGRRLAPVTARGRSGRRPAPAITPEASLPEVPVRDAGPQPVPVRAQPVRAEDTEPARDGEDAWTAAVNAAGGRDDASVRAGVPQPAFLSPGATGDAADSDPGGNGACPLEGWPREAVVDRLAEQIRAAAEAARPWKPEYDQLRTLNTKSLSWWEKVVADARKAAGAPRRGEAESSRESSQSSHDGAGGSPYRDGDPAPAPALAAPGAT
ncbi:MAG TPA: hypothetical protein VMG38_06340 [Trebonia sp.]|nr:hypothetical protein [Trebonia sp.]